MQMTRNVMKKFGPKLAAVSGAVLPMVTMAQTTDAFDTAVASLTAKVTGYGGALVALSAVAIAFYVAIKFVKKIPKAA